MTITPVTTADATRRRLLAATLAAGVGAAVPISAARQAWAAPAAPGPSQLTLPRPTGPHPVGTVALHLVDTSRPDPVAGPGHHRELMASVWYPARKTDGLPRAPWMTRGALRAFLADVGFPLDPALGPLTAAHVGAPVHRTGRRLPVLVYSHGAGSHRGDHTIMVQELASHGYAVVTVDHTYDAFSEFPDGRLTAPADVPPFLGPQDYATDIRFVLDAVEAIAAGHNPDADGRPLPQGLLGALDPRRIGAFGWSKGGTATALAMLADQRIGAGLSLDGPMQPTITIDLDRPFMMMTADFTRAGMPDVAEFWTHLHGWRLNIQADGAIHKTYGDDATLIPQAGTILGMTSQQIQDMIGTLDPTRAVRIQQAYPLAFFDQHLRHRQGHLLDGPSAAFPEVKFIP
ncbi:alpha/beta hydrolase family protein [Kitasatospora cineracea]|uniref:Platelet-activating factor acetylhydrolase isoform II n=1 Tax=Kitasatospora cineracea TaxID=88074 RepID=A0A8G1UBI5_9ACTN|nr:acetylhydrolase [Kitasatospora cineracea]ROR37674.1 platelet-activating factor acetylhydrolase isoform II [Kitasatospora cineracea]